MYKLSDKRAKPWVAMNGAGKLIGTYATSGEAVEMLDQFNADQTPLNRKDYTFSDIYEQWSPNAFAKIGEKSRASYEDAYAKSTDLYQKRIRDLKTDDYQKIIDNLVKQGFSRSLCEKQRLLFSQLCQYAMKQDIIDKNYAKFLELPCRDEVKTRILSDDEMDRIFKMVSDPQYSDTAKITLVLCYTGMRINELLRMERANVHLTDRYMIGGEKTEAGRNRTIPIHETIVPYIAEWLHGNTTKWLLHTSADTARDADNVRKAFRRLMKACDIEGVTPHTCRHTAATKLVAAKVQPEIIKQILGHSDFSMTVNRYTHTQASDLIAGINQID